MKQINFIFPGVESGPVGGYKIVYEYANRLTAIGYSVRVVYLQWNPGILRERGLLWSIPLRFIKTIIKFILLKCGLFFKVPGFWFALSPAVQKKVVLNLKKAIEQDTLKNSVWIATALGTALALHKCEIISDTQKLYLIQDFEAWLGIPDSFVYESYRWPLKKIVISEWLQQRVHSVGSDAELIDNGLDFKFFKQVTPIKGRNKAEIAMLYHLDDRKRCKDSFAALEIVKESIPDLHVNIFGVPPRPDDLPDWFTYYQQPSKEEHNALLNRSAIFIAASSEEGWGLPPAEAMICGCAVCCTDNNGFRIFAKHQETALLSPVFDPQALAKNILFLIEHPEERYRIAENGHQFIQRFTWEASVKKFSAIIESI